MDRFSENGSEIRNYKEFHTRGGKVQFRIDPAHGFMQKAKGRQKPKLAIGIWSSYQ
jgi:hypothetical protein